MPGVAVYFGALYVLEEQRLEELAAMRADDDGMAQPYIRLKDAENHGAGRRYAQALARSIRDTKWNCEFAVRNGWTGRQFRHWVETGETP